MARILVIDDDAGVRGVLKLILERAGHRLFDASYGKQGLELLAKEPVDLVLLDIEMPGLSGFEVCRAIKTNPAYADLVVVIMTGRPSDEVKERAIREGAITLLEKPFDRRSLLEGIPGWLGRASL